MALDANKPLLADTDFDAEAGHTHHSGEKDDSSAVPRMPHIGDGASAWGRTISRRPPASDACCATPQWRFLVSIIVASLFGLGFMAAILGYARHKRLLFIPSPVNIR